MTAQDTIPEDISECAKATLCEALKDLRTGVAIKMRMFGPDKQAFEQAIAKAILAERQRCADLASWIPLAELTQTSAGLEDHRTTFTVAAQVQRDVIARALMQPLPVSKKGGEA